jgi:tetratricopeptide (TPR) repeat protein
MGMLFPTIGLVQVGDQSMADRYTYLPSIGLFIFIVWGAASCIRRRPETKPFLDIFAGFCLVGLILLTRAQLPRWQDSERLFRHALAVTQNNFAAHHSLGYTLLTQGRTDEAIAEFQQTLALHPQFAEAHNNLGNAFLKKQQPQEAITHYELALTLQPRLANAHYNLGTTLLQLGRLDEARAALTQAVELQPDSPWPLLNLGNVFLQQGDTDQAIACYQKAIARQPDLADAHDNLGHVFQQVGRTDDAIQHFQTALKFSPNHANAHYHLGDLFLRQGRIDDAVLHFQQALTVSPTDADTHNALALALLQQHRIATALTHLEAALKSQADNIRTLANLSWILSTCPDDSLRQGPRAVSLAERAINLAKTDDAPLLHNLAAAQAETGQFDLAIATAQKALQLSVQAGDTSLADALRGHLTAYAAHTPLRDSSLTTSPSP